MSDNAARAIGMVAIMSPIALIVIFIGLVEVIHAWRSTKCHCKEKGTNEQGNTTDDNG